jgi:ornithine cyclodeaminase/alanine dehydrogenase-like protein (mu-crystallin family)
MLTLAQVHLTDDGAREGGHLLFACGDGRLMHACSGAWTTSWRTTATRCTASRDLSVAYRRQVQAGG